MELNSTPSQNLTTELEELDLTYAIPVGVVLVFLIITTATGNILVVTAVVRERNLHTLPNRLIASLAVTDLMVALFDLPLAASTVLVGHWPFSPVVCEFFITIDVLLCTNSIMHLVAIAIDRYWTVTDITYTRGNKKHRYYLPIVIPASWLLSAAVCLPPLFGWRQEREADDKTCIIIQDLYYTVYSTVTAFYLPLLVIIIVYSKIFLVVRERVRKKQFVNRKPSIRQSEQEKFLPKDAHSNGENGCCKYTEETTKPLDSDQSASNTNSDNYSINGCTSVSPTTTIHDTVVTTENKNGTSLKTVLKKAKRKRHKDEPSKAQRKEEAHKRKIAQKRERKALRTLMLITGVFIFCWLPFFILAVIGPFCGDWCKEHIPKAVVDFANWLGYANSLLNPIIYTIFSPDFRMAFKKILC